MATIRRTRGDDIDAACGQLVGRVNDRMTARLGQKLLHDRGGAGMNARLAIAALSVALLLERCGAARGSATSRQPRRRRKAAQINTQLGLDLHAQGNLQAAREKIEKALQQNPQHGRTRRWRPGSSTTVSARTKKASDALRTGGASSATAIRTC